MDRDGKLLVLVDADGILLDYVKTSLDLINERFGRRYLPEQVTAWDFTSLPGWEDVKDWYWTAVKQPGFCASIPPIEGAREGVEALRKVARVEVATSPFFGSPTWVHERDEALIDHFGFSHKDVHHVRKKERLTGDFLVEDHHGNLEAWERANGRFGFLWTRPYNAGFQRLGPRVSSWDQIVKVVAAYNRINELALDASSEMVRIVKGEVEDQGIQAALCEALALSNRPVST